MASDPQTTTFQTYNAGLLVRSHLRSLLEQMTFQVPSSRYKEVKSLLSSEFFVEAPPHTIQQIDQWIERANADGN